MDLCAMISGTGVVPVSDSITKYGADHSARNGAGIWSIVAAFRSQPKKASKRGSRGSQSKKESRAQALPGIAKSQTQLIAEMEKQETIGQTMLDMGFNEDDITGALEKSDFDFRGRVAPVAQRH